jgi:pyruvate/2-oxoglutarate dehydrogenase complex dihydrolipoamide dehydrogenase (E3) component
VATTIDTDICILGAGSAGLSVAAGAALLGARTVLIEPGAMGGDCLNTGCVPSKALLASAKAAVAYRHAGVLGLNAQAPEVDFKAVHDHVHGVIAGIAPQDSVERFEGMGVTVLREPGRFTGPREVVAGDATVRARRFVIATGSVPQVPPIPGLESGSYLTNETIFGLTELPRHLIVIGGGPIGCELGQAFCRLGARVTVIEMAAILPKDDPELVDILRDRLRAEGLDIREGARVTGVEPAGDGVAVNIESGAAANPVMERIEGSALLLATGRRPVVEGLGLEAAGIAFGPAGIEVDARLRTANRRVFAAGDVVGGYQFTHMASHHAVVVIKNALFRLPAKVETRAVPWVTYSDPELAQVGLTEAAARAAHGAIRVLRWPFAENDRARTERQLEGLVKVIATPRGRILGASILGAQAGESIQPWTLAIGQGLKLSAMAGTIAPYPTRGEASKRAAGSFYADKISSRWTQGLVRLLLKLG